MLACDAPPDPSEYPTYYERYVRLAHEAGVWTVLSAEPPRILGALLRLSSDHVDAPWRPGKWSPKEVIGHLTDAERVFTYRALRFARADTTDLPGYDSEAYVRVAAPTRRSVASLADEFTAVRRATRALAVDLNEAALSRRGTADGRHVSVRALLWIIAGHELHHLAQLEQVARAGRGNT
jgi:uncharacterized damage-inducible protein DinB